MNAYELAERTEALLLKLLEVPWEGRRPSVVIETEFDSAEQALQVLGLAVESMVGVVRKDAPALAEQLRRQMWDAAFIRATSSIENEEAPDGE
ncbi:hypothetical protein DEJ28_14205 [Curtobacterium sp. MCPF17_002]|uniref:hypothetical protein n=1 Tax=Curtobacterium sp. MCPF17_002 TaxID=2175645 RepID=UPI0011B83BC0|nr:hypothetical protein [Curtobacterium sp. MCPF17_002]WIB76795.1 hypothetical protein DEJ28_14205 [Curtobacterium sp. MCPF17_002]